jgi:hypothetical protein
MTEEKGITCDLALQYEKWLYLSSQQVIKVPAGSEIGKI